MKELDVRGLSCPEPVLMVREAVEAGEKECRILISEPHTKNNVEQLVKRMHLKWTTEETADGFVITTHA
ncbi:hypothetical protein ABB02_01141 [Clostridiaceae bacterium JG1575]|nr:hypothetical protein ABB02_01141 [Clostridiaceae bacterium JG1575]